MKFIVTQQGTKTPFIWAIVCKALGRPANRIKAMSLPEGRGEVVEDDFYEGTRYCELVPSKHDDDEAIQATLEQLEAIGLIEFEDDE